jgi:hypothetical protein
LNDLPLPKILTQDAKALKNEYKARALTIKKPKNKIGAKSRYA